MDSRLAHTCLFCQIFLDCKLKTIGGSCSQWTPDLYAESFFEGIKFCDIVLVSKHPACAAHMDKAIRRREILLRDLNEYQNSKLKSFSQGTQA